MSQVIRLFGQDIEIGVDENDESGNLPPIANQNANDFRFASQNQEPTATSDDVIEQTQSSELATSTNTLTTSNESTVHSNSHGHKKDKKHKKHKKEKKEHKKDKKHKHKSKITSVEIKQEGLEKSKRKHKHKHKHKSPIPVKTEQPTQTQNHSQPLQEVQQVPPVEHTLLVQTQQDSEVSIPTTQQEDIDLPQQVVESELQIAEEEPSDTLAPGNGSDIRPPEDEEPHDVQNNSNNNHESPEENNHNNNHENNHNNNNQPDYSQFENEQLPLKGPLESGDKVWIWWETEKTWFRATLQTRKAEANPPEWVVLYDDEEIHSEYEDDDIVPENALNTFAEMFEQSFDTQVLCTAYKTSKGDANEMIDYVLAHEIIANARNSGSTRSKRPKRQAQGASKKPRLEVVSTSEISLQD